MNQKVLVSDYDGTFYLNDEDLEKNKIAINKFRKAGNLFAFATGRSYYDFHRKIDKYNIKYDYVLLNHGATILDKDENIIANFYIQDCVVEELKKYLHLEKSIWGFCCSKLESRVDFNKKKLTKINIQYSSKEEAEQINNMINTIFSDDVNSYHIIDDSIEIVSKKIDKSKAIDLLLKKLNLPKENIYTIGDGYSDIGMIKDYNGYAIKGAVDELKKFSKKEFKSVSDLVNEIM